MDINYDVITFFQTTRILRRFGLAIFADIIKIVTMFIKKIIQDLKKVINHLSKSNLYLYFFM